MSNSDVRHNAAKKVKVVEPFRYHKSYKVTLSGSAESIEDAIGEALPGADASDDPQVVAVDILPASGVDVNIQFTGDDATSGNGIIYGGTSRTIPGAYSDLANISLLGVGVCSIFVITTNTDNLGIRGS